MDLPMDNIRSPKRLYTDLVRIRVGETYDVYRAVTTMDTKERSVTVKVVGDPSLNDFADNEFGVLTRLKKGVADASNAIQLMFPEPIELFEIKDHATIVTDFAPAHFTLARIREIYPNGVPPEHVAWMFNRIVMGAMEAHTNGVVHGRLLPRNVLIHSGKHWKVDPFVHTAVLIDWTCAATETSQNVWPKIGGVSEEFEKFYPSEALNGHPVSPQTDLAMAANCAIYLLGGDVASGDAYSKAPTGMADLLRTCRDPNPSRRPRDLGEFYRQFQAMLVSYFGKPRFVELPLW